MNITDLSPAQPDENLNQMTAAELFAEFDNLNRENQEVIKEDRIWKYVIFPVASLGLGVIIIATIEGIAYLAIKIFCRVEPKLDNSITLGLLEFYRYEKNYNKAAARFQRIRAITNETVTVWVNKRTMSSRVRTASVEYLNNLAAALEAANQLNGAS